MKTRSTALAFASGAAVLAALAPGASAASSTNTTTTITTTTSSSNVTQVDNPVAIGDFRHFSGTYSSKAQCDSYRKGISAYATDTELSADGKHTVQTSRIKSIGQCHIGTSGKWTYGTAVYTAMFQLDPAGHYLNLYYAGDKPSSWQMFTHHSATYKSESECNYYRNGAIDRAKKAGGWANAPLTCYNTTWNVPGQPKQADKWTYRVVDYYAPNSLSAGDTTRSIYNLNDAPLDSLPTNVN